MIKIFDLYFHKRTLSQFLLDLILLLASVVVAISWQLKESPSDSWSLLVPSFLLAGGILLTNGALGFYQRVHTRTVGQSMARAVMCWSMTLPLAYLLFRFSHLQLQNGKIFILALMSGVALVLLHRVYAVHSKTNSLMRQRVLIFGSGTGAKLVGKTLQKSDPTVELVGYYAGPNETTQAVSAWGLLSAEQSLTDIVMAEQVDEIVVALSERRGGSMPLRELLDCKLQGVRVTDIATHFEKTLGQIRLDAVSAGWLIFGDGFKQGWSRAFVKRVFDIVCATILIVLALPVMLVTAILIVLESGGPILYLQERVGLNGRLFNVIKFRSMRTDAEKDGKPRWASAVDDRATKVGRVIRKLRIDELPQLFSVLTGAMSLVGPRPERPYFVDQLTQQIPYFAVRQSVKPGVTGWAQVRYHYGATVEDASEKLQYDLYYVKNHSLFLDLVVLFETVGVVVMGKGAH
ncbi:MAG: TIGR03013 family PEP-CTERM/XrtA system glycosyltransferase [Rhodoferax sp.]|uniref:TIGR03013 family XrtA/PEP-CTERM system glycosyltransferase n=1 Tax=Rhodoferax sp. TaxID=50421 RepID=UPI002616245B|nr:TIGR03013 family XrtA/PEP-CTERM system glycosyltransferase [Rhodoferax sp.]MDD2881469.1 TIGR03013 family PEP-CTERM/XrtA system glycosyltransferase [Rhodoferax sp.]